MLCDRVGISWMDLPRNQDGDIVDFAIVQLRKRIKSVSLPAQSAAKSP